MANYVSKFNLLGEDILVRDTAATTEINNVTEKVDELENKVSALYPNQTDHENYKTDVLNNLVSYLRRNNFSSCFASGSAIGNNVLEYQQGRGTWGCWAPERSTRLTPELLAVPNTVFSTMIAACLHH